jgi:hypothetical protein
MYGNFREIIKHENNMDLIIVCCLKVLKSFNWNKIKTILTKTKLFDGKYLNEWEKSFSQKIKFEGLLNEHLNTIYNQDDKKFMVNIIIIYIHRENFNLILSIKGENLKQNPN